MDQRKLSARTRGDKPYIENTSTEHYKLIRPITEEQASQTNERFISDSGTVHNKHEDYLDEKVS